MFHLSRSFQPLRAVLVQCQLMQNRHQAPMLSARQEKVVKPLLDDLNGNIRAAQRSMGQAATVLLSIAAPLSASRPASGIPAVLLALAVVSAALSLLAGLVLLHAPVRQSRTALQTVLTAWAHGGNSIRTVSTVWNLRERLCSRLQPLALVASGTLLAAATILAALQ